MPRKPMTAAEAAGWAALAYEAKLRLKKQDIRRGDYRADLAISGTVAGYPFAAQVHGEGTQSGPQTTASSTGPSQGELVAFYRQHVPQTRLPALEAEAKALWAAEGRLPGVTEDAAKEADREFCKQCRAASTTTKAGAYTFCADPDPDDLAAAIDRDAA